MGKTGYDVFKYSNTIVTVFGIIGNILIIISILKQRCLLRRNYYFIVLQLAMCDLGALISYLFEVIGRGWTNADEEPLLVDSFVYCVCSNLFYVFQVAGVGMMLVISVLRYRATVHPLRPAINRRNLKVFCGLVYIVGVILGYGIHLPLCFPWLNSYQRFSRLFVAIAYNLFSTIFMAVAYYRVGRALFEQSKRINRLCHADALKKRHIRDRRKFLVCLSTVFCFSFGNLPISAWYIVTFAVEYKKYVWMYGVGGILRVAGSCAANPVIYGILDKQLLTFWKCCKPNILRPQA